MQMTAYESYRKVDENWVSSIPMHWDLMKISHLAALKSGENITSFSINSIDTYPVFGGNGIRGYYEEYTHEGDYVLIGRQGALCGNINYASGKFWASEHAVVVTPDRPVAIEWLGEILRTMNLGQYSVSAAQPGISVDMITKLKVPFPPLEEQQKIANFLTYKTRQIDHLIEKKKALIEKLDEQRIAVITQAVTKGIKENTKMKPSGVEWLGDIPKHWTVRRLRFCLNTNPVKSEVNNIDGNMPVSFVPMDAVNEYGGMDASATKPLEEVYSGYTYFIENDVVVAKITPCFENGKGSLAKGLTNSLGFGTTEFHVLRSTGEIDADYIFFLTISHAFRNIGASEMLGAGGQKRIPEDFIKDFRLGIPNIEEQKKIVEYINTELDRIDKMKRVSVQVISHYEEYRGALITSVVTGKIDVRNVKIPQGE